MNSIEVDRTLMISYSAFACCSVSADSCCIVVSSWVFSCWIESSVVACGWIGVPTSVYCYLLSFFFVDSLSNPLFIVTICVPKRRWKMICIDYQMFMFCASKVDGVENKESMWKHSPKTKAPCQVRLLLLPICVSSHNFFRNIFR